MPGIGDEIDRAIPMQQVRNWSGMKIYSLKVGQKGRCSVVVEEPAGVPRMGEQQTWESSVARILDPCGVQVNHFLFYFDEAVMVQGLARVSRFTRTTRTTRTAKTAKTAKTSASAMMQWFMLICV